MPAKIAGMTEPSLVAALKVGDRSAAEMLVRTHAPWMQSVARRVTDDTALAEDCVQEALINALRKIGEFEERSSLKSWLHRIVVNQALMKLRSKRSRNESSIDDLLPTFDETTCRVEGAWQFLASPDQVLEHQERRAIIHAKIHELPEIYRLVVVLRDIEGLSTREVADALDLSETNVKVRLHRARAALKKMLEPLLRGDL